MTAAKLIPSSLSCPVCQARVDVKSRHVSVASGTVRVYCSADCLRARDPRPAEPPPAVAAEPPTRRLWWWLAGGIVAGTTCLAIAYANDFGDADEPVQVPATAAFFPPPEPLAITPVDVEAAEVDRQNAEDQAVLADLAKDAWLHPLAGPTRRMPANHNGAFGAARAGERPPECVSGHCGVDLGNVWGEPVHAAHAGVVDWVNRGPNEERGGIFVKLAHRDGTLFTWYFHLAAVPKWVRPGVEVAAGQVIGLLGDTGIKHSAPHLHFAISVKPSKAPYERYLDPEPLIAIWPLWIANENGGRPSTDHEPGLPVRASPTRKVKAEAPPTEPAAETPAEVAAPTP